MFININVVGTKGTKILRTSGGHPLLARKRELFFSRKEVKV
jgi:hypothetical protein